jgi:hypothetical protein
MKLSDKTIGYYFSAILILAALVFSTYELLSLDAWKEFRDMVKTLLPMIGFLFLNILLGVLCIYLFRKGYKNGKPKKQIRFL